MVHWANPQFFTSLSSLLVALNYRPCQPKKWEKAEWCSNMYDGCWICWLQADCSGKSESRSFTELIRICSEASSSFIADHRPARLARSHWTVICEWLIVLLFLLLPSLRSIINLVQPVQVYFQSNSFLCLLFLYVCTLYTCEMKPGAAGNSNTSDVNTGPHWPRVW